MWVSDCLALFFLLLFASPFSFPSPTHSLPNTTSSDVSPERLGGLLQRVGDPSLGSEMCACRCVYSLLFPFSSHFWSSGRADPEAALHTVLTRSMKPKLNPWGRRPHRPSAISVSRLPSRAQLRSEIEAKRQVGDILQPPALSSTSSKPIRRQDMFERQGRSCWHLVFYYSS